MLASGIILSAVLGTGLLLLASRSLNLAEFAGLAFPTGIGVQTVVMVLFDWAGVPLTATSMFSGTALLIAASAAILARKRKDLLEWLKACFKFDPSGINLLWILFVVALIAVETMNFAKCIYFPTFDRDSVAGFDFIGKAIAREGTIHNLSLYADPSFYESARRAGSYIAYTPLTHCSYAYVYMAGAESSKIVNALHYLSFILVFYGVLRRFASPALTAAATFFTFITPEMIGFSSMSATNVLHACYASLGVLFFVAWHCKRDNSLLSVSGILLALNIWTRNEGIVFPAACCCVLLWQALRVKRLDEVKRLAIFALAGMAPFALWTVFLQANDMVSAQIIIFKPFWDPEKAGVILREAWALFLSRNYYGLTFITFAIAILLNVVNIVKRGDHAVTLTVTFLSLAFYTVLVYQIDYVWDSILNVMKHSYKRYLFCFVPLAWFYVAASRSTNRLFDKLTGTKTA
jgi:hypothetical protein